MSTMYMLQTIKQTIYMLQTIKQTIYMLQTIKHSHFHDVKNEGEIKNTVLSLCLRNTCIMLIDLRKRETLPELSANR